jgi:glycosyltransferase involved in cell wall biosynthesis
MEHERVIFWQDMPSIHQSAHIKALAKLLPEREIVLVCQKPVTQDRRALGWQEPDFGRAKLLIAPDGSITDGLIAKDPTSIVHIISGSPASRAPRKVFQRCAGTDALIGIQSETRDWRGWKGKLRFLDSYLNERGMRRRVDFVLAIGQLGVRWFHKCGYKGDKIFQYSYFTEKQADLPIAGLVRSNPILISFVGQCIPRKGIDVLIKALSYYAADDWTLQVVGDGPKREKLQLVCQQLGLQNRVVFLGAKANAEAINIIAQSDLCVLPSNHDGWGCVVNEALMSGVPVICSDCCGAADLVINSDRGDVFKAGSVDDLAERLKRWLKKGPLSCSERERIRAWSKCIEGGSAARYLLGIIKYVQNGGHRPAAPWLS